MNTMVRTKLSQWRRVCDIEELAVERGRAALIGREQVALFRTAYGDVYAVQQLDPFSGANVISRGIVGSRGHVPTIASPMYKQVFDLRTGDCLDSAGYAAVDGGDGSLKIWDVLIIDGDVLVTQMPVEPVPQLRSSA
ncbi:assimilatory nitrite reductase (NAD(P)H) small subunit [Antricoccus suffuscus]|uniref:Assimilatory nitrite reductase (NAD(P)H) small subunit n=1 Tax=Antricoccus suffuscus TaxID=1629062 RepID=A0A2T1A738_9ACTN|nr:nitrite reductase small subunit NirD [Antricoccus suffuscus]PRZ44287.1 assimilatory nitrite reductase (NAD(P)H) small subunit [Antricoccus suffuscus]